MEKEMFTAPERQTNNGTVTFYVGLTNLERLNVCLPCINSTTIHPDVKFQDKFTVLQNRILKELITNKQLFRIPPTLESLEAITPKWGFVVKDDQYIWNPYTHIVKDELASMKLPAYVDLVLKGIHISRSSITPQFAPVYLEQMNDSVIDFDWEKPQTEIEEISDVPASDAGTIVLKDPAKQRAERMHAKQRVRDAYSAAKTSYIAADTLAKEYIDAYDFSENESVFSAFEGEEDSSEDEVSP